MYCFRVRSACCVLRSHSLKCQATLADNLSFRRHLSCHANFVAATHHAASPSISICSFQRRRDQIDVHDSKQSLPSHEYLATQHRLRAASDRTTWVAKLASKLHRESYKFLSTRYTIMLSHLSYCTFNRISTSIQEHPPSSDPQYVPKSKQSFFQLLYGGPPAAARLEICSHQRT